MLEVQAGERGLRASEAVFAHVRNLPGLVEEVLDAIGSDQLLSVAVSVAPRPVPDSYLPPFLAGEAVARSLAALAKVPLVRTTHQEGHIRAGLAGTKLSVNDPFYALHISGGTTELLRVSPKSFGFAIDFLGGSDDLYAGQFVDRIGVLAGLGFPAGPALDPLIEAQPTAWELPWVRPRHKNGSWWTSFSGPESAAERALQGGADVAAVARGALQSIANSLAALANAAAQPGNLLVIGGVAANTLLRRDLKRLLQPAGWSVWFADPEWSRDNAIGVAHVALDAWQSFSGEENEKA